MKNMRKVLSMVLALVMVLSLSVTAFATEASTATVTVKVNGTVVDSNASVTPGQSVYTYLVAQYGIRTSDDWSEFEDINGDTAMALNSLTVKGTTYTNNFGHQLRIVAGALFYGGHDYAKTSN